LAPAFLTSTTSGRRRVDTDGRSCTPLRRDRRIDREIERTGEQRVDHDAVACGLLAEARGAVDLHGLWTPMSGSTTILGVKVRHHRQEHSRASAALRGFIDMTTLQLTLP
jgi:hypothetical protein